MTGNIDIKLVSESPYRVERWSVSDPGGREVSGAWFTEKDTRYGEKWLKSLLVGGVGTDPEYRRRGYVRGFLEEIFARARQRGLAVSVLHPFSFAYYRKFGYERVADHLILDFPLSALEFLPRCDAFERVRTPLQAREATDVTNAFSRGRALMPRRADAALIPADGDLGKGVCYLHRGADGAADGYVTISLNKTLDVNHFMGGVLTVREICYLSPEALRADLGFLRMFDGEAESVHVDNAAMAPEVDAVLRHYTHTAYRLLPDLSARVFDPEAFFAANDWPREEGMFSLRVTDPYGVASGAWRVRYGGGEARIEPLSAGAACGVTMDVSPLAPVLYGAHGLTAEGLGYLDGVTVASDSEARDLLRAFPPRARGMFEHF